jgi:hypothetical protein
LIRVYFAKVHLMDLSSYLRPEECPRELSRWARQFVGRTQGRGDNPNSKPGKRRVAGWRWDGHSDEIVLVLAPDGYKHRTIPDSIWRRMTR